MCDVFKMLEWLKLVSDWSDLLISIIDSEDFCTYKTSIKSFHSLFHVYYFRFNSLFSLICFQNLSVLYLNLIYSYHFFRFLGNRIFDEYARKIDFLKTKNEYSTLLYIPVQLIMTIVFIVFGCDKIMSIYPNNFWMCLFSSTS